MDNFIRPNDTLNIDEIMAEIRENIDKRKKNLENITGLPYSKLFNKNSFINIKDSNLLKQNINDVNKRWAVTADIEIKSKIRVFGRIVILLKRLIRKTIAWLIYPIVNQQKDFNAAVTRSLNEISGTISPLINNQMMLIKEFTNKVSTLKVYLDELSNKIEKNEAIKLDEEIKSIESTLGDKIKTLEDNMQNFKNEYIDRNYIFSLEENLRNLNNDYVSKNNMFTLEENVRNLNSLGAGINENITYINERLRRNERKISSLLVGPDDNTKKEVITSDYKSTYEFDYFHFEQIYRGSRDEIKNRQRIYLDYINVNDSILDIGCGRGEFLELLEENNIISKGIDINEDMIAYCVDKKLSVERCDAISYITKANSNEYDGIFMAQLVEHMKFDDLIKLLNLCYDKIKKDGKLIIETINAHTLYALVYSYYFSTFLILTGNLRTKIEPDCSVPGLW